MKSVDWLSPVRELFGFVFPFLERFSVIRAILGFILVFFLPGFAWSLIFFKQLKALERITLSLALSIVLVTLSLLFANRLGLRITGTNSVLIIIVVTILPVIAYYLNRVIKRMRGRVT